MGYASASITLTSSGPSQMSLEKATEKRDLRPPFERGKIPKGAYTSYARDQLPARRHKRRQLCKACALLFFSSFWCVARTSSSVSQCAPPELPETTTLSSGREQAQQRASNLCQGSSCDNLGDRLSCTHRRQSK